MSFCVLPVSMGLAQDEMLLLVYHQTSPEPKFLPRNLDLTLLLWTSPNLPSLSCQHRPGARKEHRPFMRSQNMRLDRQAA